MQIFKLRNRLGTDSPSNYKERRPITSIRYLLSSSVLFSMPLNIAVVILSSHVEIQSSCTVVIQKCNHPVLLPLIASQFTVPALSCSNAIILSVMQQCSYPVCHVAMKLSCLSYSNVVILSCHEQRDHLVFLTGLGIRSFAHR